MMSPPRSSAPTAQRSASRCSRGTKRSYRELEDFDYFGSTFYLKGPQGRGATLALLWAKEQGYWKIVSYEVEPEEATDQGLDAGYPDGERDARARA